MVLSNSFPDLYSPVASPFLRWPALLWAVPPFLHFQRTQDSHLNGTWSLCLLANLGCSSSSQMLLILQNSLTGFPTQMNTYNTIIKFSNSSSYFTSSECKVLVFSHRNLLHFFLCRQRIFSIFKGLCKTCSSLISSRESSFTKSVTIVNAG